MGGWVGGLRATIVPTLSQPTGFDNRSECGNNEKTNNPISNPPVYIYPGVLSVHPLVILVRVQVL